MKKYQNIGAIKYPDKILIETHNQVVDGFWIVTDRISFLSLDESDERIGKTLIEHLDQSKSGVPNPELVHGFKEIQDKYKKATGLKTLKSQMKDAKYVSIIREDGRIHFVSTLNGGPQGEKRGYSPLPIEDLIIDETTNFDQISLHLKLAWDKCK